MSNIHGLFSSERHSSQDDDNDDEDNSRYVGGIGARGGGSGLAVQPNPSLGGDSSASIFNAAEQESSEASAASSSTRRVITMYQSGFTVDDGPYRRLDDPANSEFLTSLAAGRTPREFFTEGSGPIEVGLVDRRKEEYVEQFSSFSGTGNSLGNAGASVAVGGVVTPPESTTEPLPDATGGNTTSVQVRLLNGKRVVIKIGKDSPVTELAERINATGMAGTDPYVLVSGFPPTPMEDLTLTVAVAGLAGAAVQQRKA